MFVWLIDMEKIDFQDQESGGLLMRKATEAKAIVGVRKRRGMIIDKFAYDNHFIIRVRVRV